MRPWRSALSQSKGIAGNSSGTSHPQPGARRPPSRRAFLAAAGAAVLAACGKQEQPLAGCPGLAGERVRLIVPYPPGGGYDTYARLLEAPIESRLGAEIVIDNESGGGGLRGARLLQEAPPDGRTLGLLNPSGLLVAGLALPEPYPNPAHDFDIIGRMDRSPYILAASTSSELRNVEDLFTRPGGHPLLFGMSGPASSTLLAMSGVESLLRLRLEVLAGYPGSQAMLMGALRGEVDLVMNFYDEIRNSIEAGDLHPLLQISDGPISDDAVLRGVDWLAGPKGWAVRRSSETGRTPEEAAAEAAALLEALNLGVLLAGPRGIPPDILACLRNSFVAASRSPEFINAARAARHEFAVMDGAAAEAQLVGVDQNLSRFAPAVRSLLERMR